MQSDRPGSQKPPRAATATGGPLKAVETVWDVCQCFAAVRAAVRGLGWRWLNGKASPCLGCCRATHQARNYHPGLPQPQEGRRDGLGCLPVLSGGQGGCARPGVEVAAPVKPVLAWGAAERPTGLATITQDCHSHRRAIETVWDVCQRFAAVRAAVRGLGRRWLNGKASPCLVCCRATRRARNYHPGLPEPQEVL